MDALINTVEWNFDRKLFDKLGPSNNCFSSSLLHVFGNEQNLFHSLSLLKVI